MSLTRSDLENDAVRAALERSADRLPVLARDAFDESLDAILAGRRRHADAWVFAYGSLIWNPLIHCAEHRLATLFGYHRGFCLWSHAGRGTPEQPGLMLGLDYGGSCRGVAFRIAADAVEHELTLLWRREMIIGSYAPRWVRLRMGGRAARALAFVVNHEHPHYAGKLPESTMIAAIVRARGRFGPCADYLEQTVASLEAHGIHDRSLAHLHRLVVAACCDGRNTG
jgi:cation transport protein ChaC